MRRRGTPWLLDSLGAPADGDFPDSLRATYAADIIRRWDPDLLFMHLVALDGAKHATGRGGEAVWTALRNADRYLGWVVAALQETNAGRATTVIVTSDHGFLPVRRVLKPGVLLARAGLIRTTSAGHVVDWDAAVVASGGTAAFIPRDDGDSTVTRRIRQAIPDALVGPGRPIRAIWPRDTIAALGGDPRAAWMIDMSDTFYTTIGYGDPLFLERGGGGHGFDPRRLGMHAFFLATGPGIQPDSRMPLLKQEDIAATVARRLGIELPNIVGRPAL